MTTTAPSSCARPSTAPATTRRSSRDGVAGAVAGEQVVSFYVHHEPTFERDEVRRHLTVVVLTPSRLILAHTDEHAGDDLLPEPYTSTSTEAISAVVGAVGRGDPDDRQPDAPARRRRPRP